LGQEPRVAKGVDFAYSDGQTGYIVPIMTDIRFGRILTPSEFETKLRGQSPSSKFSSGWTDRTKKEGIFIDLSRVEFADFSSLAQIALLVEGTVRHGINTTVALPLPYQRVGELRFVSQNRSEDVWGDVIKKRVLEREQALRFMRVSGFIDAIEVRHVPNAAQLLTIEREYDARAGEATEPHSGEVDRNYKFEYLLKKIFPMRWFEPQDEKNLANSKNFAKAVIELGKTGLEENDVEVLVGTLLHELVENVFQYANDSENGRVSCRPFALVGAIILDHGYQFKAENYQNFHQSFIEEITKSTSKIVRLVVGDSGKGIPQTLGKVFNSDKALEIPALTNSKVANEVEKILLWSLNRWSTSNLEQARIKRGTRGLWKVNRIVRSYHGFLTIRSEDAMVSAIHGLNDSKYDKAVPKPRYLNGTFVDICLAPDLAAGQTVLLPATSDATPPKFEIIYVDVKTLPNLPDDVIDELVSRLATSVDGSSKCIILAVDNMPLPSKQAEGIFRNLQSIFGDILSKGKELANPGALTIILLNVNWRQTDSSLESANYDLDSRTNQPEKYQTPPNKNLDDPILVIDQIGETRWLGGHSDTREILSSLTNQFNGETKQNITEYSQNLSPERIRQLVRDQPDIVALTENKIQLRFTARHIFEAVVSFVQNKLENTVNKGSSEGVEKGLFRTPTLETVDTWIDVTSLLEDKNLVNLAAFALAAKLKLHLGEIRGERSVIARIDNTSSKFTDAFRKCINEETEVIPFNGGLGIFENEELTDIGLGRQVIALTDIIMTANTLKHILAKLIRWQTPAQIVACLFDARQDILTSREIECLGQKIEILTLAGISIKTETGDTAAIRNIDPVLRKPLKQNPYQPVSHRISADDFLTWCHEHRTSIYLGHVEGVTGKHFLSFLNGEDTINGIGLEQEHFVQLFFESAVDWLKKLRGQSIELDELANEKVEIWYPIPDKFAVRIAEAMKEQFDQIGLRIKIRMIPRAAMLGKWVFPVNVDKVAENTKIIIVDWGALTSGTIQQMMRLALEAGATAINVLVFLSQMSPDEELALTRISSFYRDEIRTNVDVFDNVETQPTLFENAGPHDASGPVARTQVATNIEFFSHLDLRFYMPSECPICMLRESFQREANDCQIEMLREYAEKRQKSLKAQDRDSIFENNINIYGESLESGEIVELLRVWQKLNLALRFTEKRFEILTEINLLVGSNDVAGKNIWIRALSSDPNWLKVHPLRFEILRELVSTLAIEVIQDQSTPTQVVQQALIVLRVASIFRYISELPTFFKRFLLQHETIQQLLYDIYSYLNKEVYESLETIHDIQKSLLDCKDCVLDHAALEIERRVEYLLTLGNLLRISDFKKQQQEYRGIETVEALAYIRERYIVPMGSHDGVIDAMNLLYSNLVKFSNYFQPSGDKSDGMLPSTSEMEKCVVWWQTCEEFLYANVLPFLDGIKELIFGHYYISKLSPEDRQQLGTITGKNSAAQATTSVSLMLQRLSQQGEQTYDIEEGSRCFDKINWWNGFFLEADSDDKYSPRFIKLLKGCPSELVSRLAEAIENNRKRGYHFTSNELPQEQHIKVFCDGELLQSCVTQIIQNAFRRIEKNNAEIRFHWSIQDDDSDNHYVWLIAKNSGSEPTSHGRGRGLVSLNASLRGFRGSIEGGPIVETSEWSYEARLRLMKWRHLDGRT
jgi:hypothetical protein